MNHNCCCAYEGERCSKFRKVTWRKWKSCLINFVSSLFVATFSWFGPAHHLCDHLVHWNICSSWCTLSPPIFLQTLTQLRVLISVSLSTSMYVCICVLLTYKEHYLPCSLYSWSEAAAAATPPIVLCFSRSSVDNSDFLTAKLRRPTQFWV